MQIPLRPAVGLIVALMAGAVGVHAGEPFAGSAPSADGERYGLFNLLDHRSSYGQGVYPEPFLVDDSDLETGELRLDWLHTQGHASRSDTITTEVEKGFGLLTVELEVHYQRDQADGHRATAGLDNVDLGARYPLLEYVSPGGGLDTVFGVGIEIGLPIDKRISDNAEFVPKIFNDTKIGNFTLQSIIGYSILSYGGGEDSNLQVFEYGFVFGYTITHESLPLPGVLQLIPVFEISGERTLNRGSDNDNSLVGNLGFRANLKAIGPLEPRLGVGFVFPLNDTARADTHWGVVTSAVFEY